MRIAVLAALALLLLACQGPAQFSDLRPIAAPVTLGNAPVVNALARDRETIVGYRAVSRAASSSKRSRASTSSGRGAACTCAPKS
jgi:hypothetical protein